MTALSELQPNAMTGADILRERFPAQAALSEAVAMLADDLPPQKTSASGAYAPGEHPYLPVTASAANYSGAIEAWLDRFLTFVAESKGDVLWWRAKPTITGEVDCETGEPRWTVYARCALGNAE